MHLGVNVGQKVFGSLKLFFVKTLKDRSTWHCMYHTKLNELRLANEDKQHYPWEYRL